MMLDWEAAAATDRGRVRRRNEDAFLVLPDRRLYAVADGMGGHAAGNIASALAIRMLETAFARAPSPRIGRDTLAARLAAAFVDANAAIMARSVQRPSETGMGTTLTALATMRSEPLCLIAHIGDSRAYRFRPADTSTALVQLTRDHTWVQQQVEAGALSPAEARVHPWSSILTRVLGMEQPGDADIIVADALPGDTFLLCSDGLTGMMTDDEIATILTQPLALQDIASQLIDAANGAGGRDNVTVALLRALR